MRKYVILGSLLLVMVTGAVILKNRPAGGIAHEVTWEVLGQLDFVSGVASADLKNLDGARVRVPGFMVPLEDSQKSVKEFLLVPTPQACIHVPPPPPNQMVFISMDNEETEVAFGPIWVYGKLKMTAKKHMYGEASFEMEGEYIEPYR